MCQRYVGSSKYFFAPTSIASMLFEAVVHHSGPINAFLLDIFVPVPSRGLSNWRNGVKPSQENHYAGIC